MLTEPSNARRGRCWASNPFDQPRRRSRGSNSCTRSARDSSERRANCVQRSSSMPWQGKPDHPRCAHRVLGENLRQSPAANNAFRSAACESIALWRPRLSIAWPSSGSRRRLELKKRTAAPARTSAGHTKFPATQTSIVSCRPSNRSQLSLNNNEKLRPIIYLGRKLFMAVQDPKLPLPEAARRILCVLVDILGLLDQRIKLLDIAIALRAKEGEVARRAGVHTCRRFLLGPDQLLLPLPLKGLSTSCHSRDEVKSSRESDMFTKILSSALIAIAVALAPAAASAHGCHHHHHHHHDMDNNGKTDNGSK